MELTDAKNLAESLMNHYGLKEWKFKFDSAKRRFGCCWYGKKTITLSKDLVLLNSYDRVKDTILHEIAHALTPGHHHDNVWKQKAIEIGCNGNRCYTSKDTIVIPGKYILKCTTCEKSYQRMKKPRRSLSCYYCGGGYYDPKFKLVVSQNNVASGSLPGLMV